MLKLENIKKTFNPGTVNEKWALQGLSLHLKPGDFATIIGSNGAGKSTMMNAIAGVFYVTPYVNATNTELYAFNKVQAYNEGYIR